MTAIVCRTCLTKERKTTSLLAIGTICGKEVSLGSVLAKCADLQCSTNDVLPQQICVTCIRQVEEAYSFRVMCERNQNILLEQAKKKCLPDIADAQVVESEIAECNKLTEGDKDYNTACNEVHQNPDNSRIVKKAALHIYNVTNKSIDKSNKNNFIQNIAAVNSKKTREPKQDTYSCTLCRISYKFKSSLELHNRHAHTGAIKRRVTQTNFNPPQSLTCKICNKTGYSANQYKRHMNVHETGKKYHCDICKRDFAQHRTFVSHIYSHTGERPFLCTVCGKTFKQNVDLRSHMRLHLNLYPYSCPTCGRKFRHHSTFILHKRRHTGEKPFSCPICDKRFVSNDTMLEHKKTHTGEKPFPCSVCGKAFARRCALKVHSQSHTGVKPHICTKCNKGFSQAHCLRSHMKTHHENDVNTLQSDMIKEINNELINMKNNYDA